MLRMTAAAIAGLGCAALGYALAAAAGKRLRLLRALAAALLALRTGICGRRDSLPDALGSLPGEDTAGQAWAGGLALLGKRLKATPGMALREAWAEVWPGAKQLYPDLRVLEAADLQPLQPLWEQLGQGDLAEQQRLLDSVLAELTAHSDALQKKLPDTQRLCQALGALGGLCLFLFLM